MRCADFFRRALEAGDREWEWVCRVRLRTDVMVQHECKQSFRVVRKRTLRWIRRATSIERE